MEEILYFNDLYDYYKELLTEKQKHYFEEYYFDNLSLTEIAENHNISKNAVSKQLKIVVEKLKEYEEKLELSNKSKKIMSLIELIDNENLKSKMKELI